MTDSPHVVAAFALLVLVGCELPGKPDPSNQPVPSNEVLDFDPLYERHCAACHGVDGQLGPAPPLNDPLFLAIVPDKEVLRIIRYGRAIGPDQNSLMPAFSRSRGGTLTDPQIKVLAAGIKERWGGDPPKGKPPPLLVEGTGDKKAGLAVFADACSMCHGEMGKAGEVGGRQIGALDRAFLSLISDQELRRYIITGRHDLGMPNYAGTAGRSDDFRPLTSQQITDLVALLADFRQGGAKTKSAAGE